MRVNYGQFISDMEFPNAESILEELILIRLSQFDFVKISWHRLVDMLSFKH